MRAIQISEFGGPEVLELVELPDPVPAEGEVLIRVRRAGLNFADTHQRTNSYLSEAKLPLIPGSEVAGVRDDTGERVVAMCGGGGGYAELATAAEAFTFPVPDGVDDETALALLLQGLTAWHLYKTCAHVAAGESVVVHAAAGGVGSIAVQLGKAFGARVIATASSEDKRRLALDLGADAATDASAEAMTERLIECNDGRRVDAVFEMSGGEVFEQSLRALAPFGRMVVYGMASGRPPRDIATGTLMRHSTAVIGFWLIHCLGRPEMVQEPLADLFARAARGELRAVIGGTYPLSEAGRAQADMQARRTTGKLLLDPSR
jgi:NADPH2:quinone reductase